ncbi:monovalent cation/H+ antiporter complex subunit F [Streptomyces sp. NBC_00370]|uniref:monovalent cation/H+ antiporter complex subunit F n=1 Tax=Streptomyces sp. NBC_00370 TaxID=2975728 RepID=UPI002E2561E1
MNGWLLASAVLLAGGVAPALWAVATGPIRRRVVAQNMATLVVCLVLLLLAQGYARTSYVDAGLVLALLGPAGTLIYARLFAEELRADPPRGRLADAVSAGAAVAVVVPLCVVAEPGRSMVKLIVIGTLLVAGNQISSRALREQPPGEQPPGEQHPGARASDGGGVS